MKHVYLVVMMKCITQCNHAAHRWVWTEPCGRANQIRLRLHTCCFRLIELWALSQNLVANTTSVMPAKWSSSCYRWHKQWALHFSEMAQWIWSFPISRSLQLSAVYFIVWRDSFLSLLKSTAFECLNKTAWSFPGDETLSLFLLPPPTRFQ